MKIEDISALARKTLEPQLTPHGFEGIDVSPYVDSIGDNALKVTVRLRTNSPTIPGDISLDVMSALSSALLDQGEERFPYILFDHQDQPSDEMDDHLTGPRP